MATEVLFIEYPKCSTCKKAKKWLDDHGVSYIDRHIVEDNPQAAEIADWQERSGLPVRRFFQHERHEVSRARCEVQARCGNVR